MEEEKKEKIISPWYFRQWVIVIAILGFGPLGLPLLWLRPRTNIYFKILISVLVFGVAFWMAKMTARYYQQLLSYYNELSQTL